MKAGAEGINTFFHFFFLALVIQQQERAMFKECNLFMVIALEKGEGAELFCTVM